MGELREINSPILMNFHKYTVFSALCKKNSKCYHIHCIQKSRKRKNRREGFIISQLQLNYTSEMEKAMHGAHKVSYAVYSQKHEVRMKVEMRRERDYLQSQRIVADLDRKIHS